MMDWRKGDLALCIKMGEWRSCNSEVTPAAFPRPGGVYTVSQVQLFLDAVGLHFQDVPPTPNLWGDPIPFDATRFRKIDKREADTFDREVIAALTGEPVFHSPLNDAVHNSCQPQVSGRFTAGQVGEAG